MQARWANRPKYRLLILFFLLKEFVTLVSVAFPAKSLKVFGCGTTAFSNGNDVVDFEKKVRFIMG